MELQRPLLLGAIAVLAFMLLTEWVAFRDEHNRKQALASATAPIHPTVEIVGNPAATVSTPSASASGIELTSAETSDDVPLLENPSSPSIDIVDTTQAGSQVKIGRAHV